MTIALYGITNCDTMKKARAFLANKGIEYRFHDYKSLGVPPGELDRWIAEAGWERLLNRQGTTWRKLDAAAQSRVTDAVSARALMLEQPSVIRRPVLVQGARVVVGFDEGVYAALGEG